MCMRVHMYAHRHTHTQTHTNKNKISLKNKKKTEATELQPSLPKQTSTLCLSDLRFHGGWMPLRRRQALICKCSYINNAVACLPALFSLHRTAVTCQRLACFDKVSVTAPLSVQNQICRGCHPIWQTDKTGLSISQMGKELPRLTGAKGHHESDG